MLESFEIVNFESIFDLKIDLKYGETTAPRHYQDSESWAFLETRNGKKGRFVSTLVIYGANADIFNQRNHSYNRRVLYVGVNYDPAARTVSEVKVEQAVG